MSGSTMQNNPPSLAVMRQLLFNPPSPVTLAVAQSKEYFPY